jgi:hypothetical protein
MGPMVRNQRWDWMSVAIALSVTCAARADRYQSLEANQPPAAASGTAPATSVATSDVQPEQIVILQDGGVLRGAVTRDGERYVLARGNGQTFIPAGNVLLVAGSLDEAYQQRRERLSPPTVEGHIVLAEWCLQHDLLPNAERELADIRALEPQHARLELLERRLALANERQRKQGEAAARGLADSPPVAVSAPPVATAIGDLPPGAIERFTRKVQPVLVNSCTSSGCHHLGGATQFQLDRAILRGMSNRRTTTHNLTATLALVDREQPRLSPLLTVPRRTHGGMKEPVFGPRREAAFRHLDEWVELVTAGTAQPFPPATLNESGELDADLDAAAIGEKEPPVEPGGVDAISTPRYGARLEHWQPRDPFDPEIFNRKYAPRANENAEVEASNSAVKGEP